MRWLLRVRARIGALELDVELEGGREPLNIVGPNGAGKTTLLRILAGAHRPSSGRIQVGERVLFDATAGHDLPPEARRVGYVPQGYGLFPHLSAVDNVMLNLLQEQAAGGDQLLLGRQGREPCGDQIGIDESRAGRLLRQVLQCKRRFSRAIRTGDDPTDARFSSVGCHQSASRFELVS